MRSTICCDVGLGGCAFDCDEVEDTDNRCGSVVRELQAEGEGSDMTRSISTPWRVPASSLSRC